MPVQCSSAELARPPGAVRRRRTEGEGRRRPRSGPVRSGPGPCSYTNGAGRSSAGGEGGRGGGRRDEVPRRVSEVKEDDGGSNQDQSSYATSMHSVSPPGGLCEARPRNTSGGAPRALRGEVA